MSRLATIKKEIADTAALLRAYENAIATDPALAEVVEHDMRSLQKLQRQFETELRETESLDE